MNQGLLIGKEVDVRSGELGELLSLDPGDLLTHGLIVGMTGSGKTGMGVALIEELLRRRIPVIAIDPKGDLGNLLLLFDDLSPAAFEPWIDAEQARREGKSLAALAEESSRAWRQGLGEWGLTAADVAALRQSREAVVFTPGSSAGVPLNLLQSLAAPAVPFEQAAEDLREEIAALVSGLLGLVKVESDALQSKPAVLLANLIEHAWRAGRGLTLEGLIPSIADPPFDKMGALPLETVYPRREREGLMLALNNLLAAPSFEAWRSGEPLDVEKLLWARDGRPRLSIISTAHLADAERLFVTALVLEKVKTWMRRQSGTSDLRAVVYMDEIFGYFPPHPLNPPTKPPLLTLLKQARAQGVGVVLATQNPVDLDYRGLANMGLWLVGRLQTEQDRARLREGLLGAGGDAKRVDELLGATRKRVFLLHDVHRKEPCLVHSRWTMSFLRGPLTRDDIQRLRGESEDGRDAARVPAPVETASVVESVGPPPLPAPLKAQFLARHGGDLATPFLCVKHAARYKGLPEAVATRAYPLSGASPAEVLEGEAMDIAEAKLVATAPAGLRFAPLPAWMTGAAGKLIEKAVRDRLPDKLAIQTLFDPYTKSTSAFGEDRQAFAARLRGAGGGEAQVSRLREQITKKQRDLATLEEELKGRRVEKWAAIGGAILSNIGLLRGRKRTISGAGTVLTKNRMENTAEARIERTRAELAELEGELAKVEKVDPARFEERELVPTRGGVDVLRLDVVWIY